MTTRSDCCRLARSFGCGLFVGWTGTDWWIEIRAPEGHVFHQQDISVDCSVYGNGHPERDLDWSRVAESIRAICAEGFDVGAPC